MLPPKPFEFLAFSDSHFHDFAFQATDTAEFAGMQCLNSRLVDAVHQFESMIAYAKKRNIKHIFFCGDLYHNKKTISKDVTNVLMKLFIWAETEIDELRIVMIPGNHDYVDKAGTNHSLIPFEALQSITVIDNHGFTNDYIENIDEVGILLLRGIPYVEDKEELIHLMHTSTKLWEVDEEETNLDPVYRILLSHSGMQGARVGSDFVMIKDHDLSVSDVPNTLYDICLFGHFHEHQRVFDNGWIVGASSPINWSDAGGKRGFMYVSITPDKQVTVVHVPTVESVPRFHILENGNDFTGVRPIDFVKYHVEEQLSEELLQNTKGYIAAIIGDVPKFLELIPPNVKSEEAELSEKAISADSVLDEWIEAKAATSLDKVKLAEIGKELLLAARAKLE